MKGVQDMLIVYDDKLTITPKGLLGFFNKGLKGTKTIPYSSIQAIQFKESGVFVSGYLQFTIPGGNESKGGVLAAASDENSFMFAGTKNNAEARQIKEFVEQAVAHSRATIAHGAPSIADELLKLSSLRTQGLLTDAEFLEAKSRLLK
jgi:hypothetical protein